MFMDHSVPTTLVQRNNDYVLSRSFPGPFEDVVSVSITPSSGEIGPREQRRCQLDFISHLVGPLTGLGIACQVEGMGKPVYLSLAAQVAGLHVSLATTEGGEDVFSAGMTSKSNQPLLRQQQSLQQQQHFAHPPGGIPIFKEEDQENLCVNFGSACKLGATVKRYLWIRNDTAIAAPFRVEIDHFRATSQLTLEEVTPPPATPVRSAAAAGAGVPPMTANSLPCLRPGGIGVRSAPTSNQHRRPILEKTANLGDAKSKTKKKVGK